MPVQAHGTPKEGIKLPNQEICEVKTRYLLPHFENFITLKKTITVRALNHLNPHFVTKAFKISAGATIRVNYKNIRIAFLMLIDGFSDFRCYFLWFVMVYCWKALKVTVQSFLIFSSEKLITCLMLVLMPIFTRQVLTSESSSIISLGWY